MSVNFFLPRQDQFYQHNLTFEILTHLMHCSGMVEIAHVFTSQM